MRVLVAFALLVIGCTAPGLPLAEVASLDGGVDMPPACTLELAPWRGGPWCTSAADCGGVNKCIDGACIAGCDQAHPCAAGFSCVPACGICARPDR